MYHKGTALYEFHFFQPSTVIITSNLVKYQDPSLPEGYSMEQSVCICWNLQLEIESD